MEVFKNNNGEFLLCDDTRLASILGFNHKVVTKTPNPELIGTGVFDNVKKKILSEEELKELIKKVEDLRERCYEASIEEIKEITQRYLFVLECDYRGGEKHKTIIASVCEDPEYQVADELDYPEYWEYEAISNDVWDILREIIEIRKSDEICY